MLIRNSIKVLVAAMAALAQGALSAPLPVDRAWVEMAPESGILVRVLTMAATCPAITVAGRLRPMAPRAVPAQLASRPNKAQVADGSVFPGRVCELALPRGTRRASLAGAVLPLPPARINRIVLIGDTGCRLKDADHAYQGCNDSGQWPFAAIAARAATLHPDLVLHVGDYLYRENPCAEGHPGCAGAIWGYGEAGWRADFLDPATPLLAAAPWAMVRGNHEECARAGQGWWRLFDPHPLVAGQDCNDAAQDIAGNHTDPYRVELGGGTRLIVADFDELANGKVTDPAFVAAVRADLQQIDTLANGARDSFVTAHYPLNAVLWDKTDSGAVTVGIKGVVAPLQPGHVRAMLAGHIHLFQYARFADRPTQVITGFSGTLEDAALAPANLAEAQGKRGTDAVRALTTITGRFGYALMERERERHVWRLTVYAADGTVMGRYAL